VTDAKHLTLGGLSYRHLLFCSSNQDNPFLLEGPIIRVSMIVPLPQLLDVPAGASPNPLSFLCELS